MTELALSVTDALLSVTGWLGVLGVSLAVCIAVRAAGRALAPLFVGVLVRLGVIE
jgi:hypothetical protein